MKLSRKSSLRMAMLCMAMRGFLSYGQLKFHNIWPIGDRGFVIDFNTTPPNIYRNPLLTDKWPTTRPFQDNCVLCDSNGKIKLSVGWPEVRDKNKSSVWVPNVKIDGYRVIAPQMPNTHNSTYYGFYDNYYYTNTFPLDLTTWVNFSDNPITYDDSILLNLKYKWDTNWRILAFGPDCARHLLCLHNADKDNTNGPFYNDITEIVNGKITRIVHQGQTSQVRKYVVAFSPDLNVCLMFDGNDKLSIHNFNSTSLLYNLAPLWEVKNSHDRVSFSLDGRKLYYLSNDSIFQSDISYLIKDSINKNTRFIFKLPANHVFTDLRSMQLSPSGKILISIAGEKKLSVIHSPDKSGTACDFRYNDQDVLYDSIVYGIGEIGIPDYHYFPSGAFYNPGLKIIRKSSPCLDEPLVMEADHPKPFISIIWKVKTPTDQLYMYSGDSITFTPTSPGKYIVSFIYNWSCGLSDSTTDSFSILPPTVPPKIEDSILCDGMEYQYVAPLDSSAFVITWRNGSGIVQTGPKFRATTSDTYFVEYVNSCYVYRDTFELFFHRKPQKQIADIYVKCSFMNGVTLSVAKPDKADISWSNGSASQTTTFTSSGTHWLRIYNACFDSTWAFMVRDENPDNVLFVPSAFTPNGDDLNEKFQYFGLEEMSDFRCIIFNIWGEKIFETTSKTEFWNGKIKNQEAQSGPYIYYIKGTSICSGEKSYRGTVYLLPRSH